MSGESGVTIGSRVVQMGGKKTLLGIIILVFSVLGGNVHSLGAREDPVDVARTLIVDQRYNEALLILAEAARRDSNRMDEVERLIRRIRNIRGSYNDKYEELITVLYTDKDVKKALDIIADLESLDTNPNPATQSAILRAKESALFVYNRDLFNAVMEKAAAQLEQKEYWGAVETYLTGFSIGREGFDNAGYGNIVTGGTDAALESLKKASEIFLQGRKAQTEALRSLREAGQTPNPGAVEAAVAGYLAAVRPAALLFKTAMRSHETLFEKNRLAGTIRGGVREEDFFLGITMRFAAGRRNAVSPEGLKGAAELMMKEASLFARRLRERSETALSAGRGLLQPQEVVRARKFFTDAGVDAAAAERVLALWFEAVPPELGVADPLVWNAVASETGLYLGVSTARGGAAAYADLAGVIQTAHRDPPPPDAGVPELRAYRGTLRNGEETLELLEGKWGREMGSLRDNPLSDETARGLAAGLLDDLGLWGGRLRAMEAETVDRIAGLEIRPLNDGLAARSEDFRRAQSFLDGVEKRVEMPGGGVETAVFRYPSESLEILGRLPGALSSLRKSTEDFIAAYRNENPGIRDYPELTAKTTGAGNNLAEIEKLEASVRAAGERARESLLLAERYKNEGNRKIAEAESAIRQGNYDLAGENIKSARQAFSTSLSHQEDPAFRRQSDARLLALDAEIVKALNNQIVLEVRRLLNEGKRLYDGKDFFRAESVLAQAQSRWRTTHIEDEPEVKRWLGYVRAALSVKADRVLLETDPLYPEMNQLLNLARQDYSRGKELMDKGSRREALVHLARAEEKIRQVTMTFPYNQEASVLQLRIAQIKDREAFAARFRSMFKEASEKLKTKPEEGYRDLLDLEQIDPNFPGLKAAIFEIEIILKIRTRPPSRQDITESEVLYDRAASIVSSNNRSQFAIALDQLNRAIELNPDNRRAMELKDRVQIAVGGQTSVVLSSVAEDQYRNAERLFIAGNYFEALAIVERLLQNKETRNYPPLLELKRRIESRI